MCAVEVRLQSDQKRYEPIKISRDFLSSVACAISDLQDDVRGAIDLRASLAISEEVHLLVDTCQCPSPKFSH